MTETYAWIKRGNINGSMTDEIVGISTIEDYDMTTKCIIDGSTSIDFAKTQGYTLYLDEQGYNHIKFDEDKYNAYLAQVEKDKANAEAQSNLDKVNEELLSLISVTEEASDKKGYNWKVYKIGDVVVKKEYIEIETVNDGSDYTKPITYKVGMSVEKELWYTDGSDVWEALKDGTPLSFADTEYFDIVTA